MRIIEIDRFRFTLGGRNRLARSLVYLPFGDGRDAVLFLAEQDQEIRQAMLLACGERLPSSGPGVWWEYPNLVGASKFSGKSIAR